MEDCRVASGEEERPRLQPRSRAAPPAGARPPRRRPRAPDGHPDPRLSPQTAQLSTTCAPRRHRPHTLPPGGPSGHLCRDVFTGERCAARLGPATRTAAGDGCTRAPGAHPHPRSPLPRTRVPHPLRCARRNSVVTFAATRLVSARRRSVSWLRCPTLAQRRCFRNQAAPMPLVLERLQNEEEQWEMVKIFQGSPSFPS